MNSQRELFRAEITRILGEEGPRETADLYKSVKAHVPASCDERILCTCGGKITSRPEWQHHLRWAQQDLKKAGVITRTSSGWDLVRNTKST